MSDDELLASVVRKFLTSSARVLVESVEGRNRVAIDGLIEITADELAAVDRAYLSQRKGAA